VPPCRSLIHDSAAKGLKIVLVRVRVIEKIASSTSGSNIKLLAIGDISSPLSPRSSAGERVGVRGLTIQPIMHSLINTDLGRRQSLGAFHAPVFFIVTDGKHEVGEDNMNQLPLLQERFVVGSEFKIFLQARLMCKEDSVHSNALHQ
jgi:hypothetical protein